MKALGKLHSPTMNQSGQGLIEYLIIVALMGVATMGIMRVMSGTVISTFSNVTSALQSSEKKFKAPTLVNEVTKQKDMSDFMDGASDKKNGSK